MFKFSFMPLLTGALLIATITGCGTAPPATRYLLPSMHAVGAMANPDSTTAPAVRLADVRLPSYVADAAIAYLRADGSVAALPGEQWAEDPQPAITRALGSALREARGGATVIYEPWPVGLESAGSVSVSIHRMLGMPGGETRLSGQFLLVSSQRVLRVYDFDLREPVVGNDTPALLRSYAKALTSLGTMLAAKLDSP